MTRKSMDTILSEYFVEKMLEINKSLKNRSNDIEMTAPLIEKIIKKPSMMPYSSTDTGISRLDNMPGYDEFPVLRSLILFFQPHGLPRKYIEYGNYSEDRQTILFLNQYFLKKDKHYDYCREKLSLCGKFPFSQILLSDGSIRDRFYYPYGSGKHIKGIFDGKNITQVIDGFNSFIVPEWGVKPVDNKNCYRRWSKLKKNEKSDAMKKIIYQLKRRI